MGLYRSWTRSWRSCFFIFIFYNYLPSGFNSSRSKGRNRSSRSRSSSRNRNRSRGRSRSRGNRGSRSSDSRGCHSRNICNRLHGRRNQIGRRRHSSLTDYRISLDGCRFDSPNFLRNCSRPFTRDGPAFILCHVTHLFKGESYYYPPLCCPCHLLYLGPRPQFPHTVYYMREGIRAANSPRLLIRPCLCYLVFIAYLFCCLS